VVAATALAIIGSMTPAAHAEPSKAELTKKIDTASDQLEDVTESYNKLKIELAQTIADQKTLAASLAPTKAKLQVASAQVDTIANTSYKQGRLGPMRAVIGSNGQDSLVDRMTFLDQITRANQRDITTFTETTETYAERQAALKATQAKETAQLKELDAQKKKIQGDIKKLKQMRTAAFGTPEEKASAGAAGPAPNISGSAGEAVDYAYVAANKPAYYGFGDEGPNTYDCSGLTKMAWKAAGKSLSHNAAAQYRETARISKSELQPGDLVFYRALKHVGIYVGGGMIIDASRQGEPVKKRSINVMTPYGYGRVR
jgi:cell wall-associated NlpC family hydrolase